LRLSKCAESREANRPVTKARSEGRCVAAHAMSPSASAMPAHSRTRHGSTPKRPSLRQPRWRARPPRGPITAGHRGRQTSTSTWNFSRDLGGRAVRRRCWTTPTSVPRARCSTSHLSLRRHGSRPLGHGEPLGGGRQNHIARPERHRLRQFRPPRTFPSSSQFARPRNAWWCAQKPGPASRRSRSRSRKPLKPKSFSSRSERSLSRTSVSCCRTDRARSRSREVSPYPDTGT
jgi:hypothetical protein